MHLIDILIFVIYFMGMLGVGYYFLHRNKSDDDYYVGGRNMNSWHIGLSVVATDVGGGFSIGLGGLGFMIGLSGSWLLFTGFIGAWISAVILIPKVWNIANKKKFFTLPQLFEFFFDKRVAAIAAVISAIGYIGFTSSQILAGAKLTHAAFPALDQQYALILMGLIIVVYTAMGGIKAVIYTDTIQWSLLLTGLVFIGIPVAYQAVGGWETIKNSLDPQYLSLTNLSFIDIVNWLVTIVPIWFVGMTLYQRIYASKSEKSAKRAWFIAGLFEWPIMAFMGVTLGLLGRVAADIGLFAETRNILDPANLDPELGLPLLLVHVLPVGLLGIMMSAYFSAIMSTADSCLMAASGNVVTDIVHKLFPGISKKIPSIRLSQFSTLLLGILALTIAWNMANVLELMLYSYAFMVSGLFVPILAAIATRNPNSTAAFYAMFLGGGTTISLIIIDLEMPLDLDENIFGITVSFVVYLIVNNLKSKK